MRTISSISVSIMFIFLFWFNARVFTLSLTKDLYRKMRAKGLKWMTMNVLFFLRWELVIVAYNVWNKTPESVAKISQQGGPKTTRGETLFKYNSGCSIWSNRGPNVKWGAGRTPLAPHWRRPWSVDRFTPAFFVSFIVTGFVPDSPLYPKNAYRDPAMVNLQEGPPIQNSLGPRKWKCAPDFVIKRYEMRLR